MLTRKQTSSALGAALALAITLSTAVAPAFAETPTIDIFPSKPTIHRDIGPLPAPKPETSTVTFVPDVRVNYIGKSAGSGGKVTYRFRVENIGAASAANVGLDTRIYQLSNATFPPTDSVATMQSGNGGTIASLNQDATQEVTIVCTPLAGNHCDGARLTAVVADDLDPTNNMAVGE
jgi:hypothetical protein